MLTHAVRSGARVQVDLLRILHAMYHNNQEAPNSATSCGLINISVPSIVRKARFQSN